MIVLSHAMSMRFEELSVDQQAADKAYEAATRVYQNTLKSFAETNNALWRELYDTYPQLDQKTEYKASFDIKERRVCITEKEA